MSSLTKAVLWSFIHINWIQVLMIHELVYSCSPGLKGDRRPEEDAGRPSALHYPQHHRVRQAPSDVPWPRPGRPAGRAGELGSEGEHPQPEGGSGHRPEGRREAGSEEEEKAEQSQSSELPEEEKKERCPNATKEDRGGGEEEKKSTQEAKRRAVGSRCYKCIMRTPTIWFFFHVV